MRDTDSTQNSVTRRRLVQTAGATVLAPSFINVATADTASGNVELTTTATIPTSTTIEVTVFEDTNGDGTADRQESVTIADGTNTYEMSLLESSTAQGDVLWIQLDLSTSDDSVTPSIDSATLTLPETPSTPTATATPTEEPADQPEEPQTLEELWNNYLAFVAAVVLGVTGLIGVMSRSLAVGAWTGYLAFVYIALTAGTPLFRNIALVTMVLVFLGSMFKLVRLEFEGEE